MNALSSLIKIKKGQLFQIVFLKEDKKNLLLK
jgi:hypothetical protein